MVLLLATYSGGSISQGDEGRYRCGVGQDNAGEFVTQKEPTAVGVSGPLLSCAINVNRENGNFYEDLVDDLRHRHFVRQNVCVCSPRDRQLEGVVIFCTFLWSSDSLDVWMLTLIQSKKSERDEGSWVCVLRLG